MAIVGVRKHFVAAGMATVSTRKPVVSIRNGFVGFRKHFDTAGMTKETAGMSIVSVRNDAVGRRKHLNNHRETFVSHRVRLSNPCPAAREPDSAHSRTNLREIALQQASTSWDEQEKIICMPSIILRNQSREAENCIL